MREEGTGEPLPGAVVRIGEGSTRTDDSGRYELEIDAEDGRPQPVFAYKPGYAPTTELLSFDEEVELHDGDLQLRRRAPSPEQQVDPAAAELDAAPDAPD